jgi:hypothetical protein
LACSSEPAFVVVPGESYSESIRVFTEHGDTARIEVGQPLALHGERRSGPWVSVREDAVDEESCRLSNPPPALEQEVAASLRWDTSPAGAAVFDPGLRPDLSREVRFTAPGRYSITARSAAWCGDPYSGNTLWVEVTGP